MHYIEMNKPLHKHAQDPLINLFSENKVSNGICTFVSVH